MSLGQTAPTTPTLSVGRLQPSVVSLRNREQQSLRLDVEIFQAPRGGAKAGPWPLAPASIPFPGAALALFRGPMRPSLVPRRAHLCGLAPPRLARPATSGPRPRCPNPSPRPGPPPSGFPAAAADGQPASPAKAVRRPTSALAAWRFRPSTAAGGDVLARGTAGKAPPLLGRPAPVPSGAARNSARSVGQAQGGSPALRLGGPAGRSQVHRGRWVELSPGSATGPQSVRAARRLTSCSGQSAALRRPASERRSRRAASEGSVG